MIRKILVIHGPNLNLLGEREPGVYGNSSIDTLNSNIIDRAKEQGLECEIFQSNHEGAIVDEIQRAYFTDIDGIILNPAAYTHTSIAIADALKAVKIPTVEVHLSAVEERESFRQISYVRDIAIRTITGKGFAGYLEAVDILISESGKQHECYN